MVQNTQTEGNTYRGNGTNMIRYHIYFWGSNGKMVTNSLEKAEQMLQDPSVRNVMRVDTDEVDPQ